MEILLFNLDWMSWNIFLALVGVFLGFLLNVKQPILKIVFFILWLLFVPNTIYLLTDIQYLPEQFLKLEFFNQIILFVQYFIVIFLGITTFLLGLSLFEKNLPKNCANSKTNMIMFFLNYFIGFAVFLGKIERVNSWSVFTEPQKVIVGSLNILSSEEMLIIILFFGTFANILYFTLRKGIRKLK